MVLLDRMIATSRFREFVTELVKAYNDELQDRTMWDFWLHRIHDMSYAEFAAAAKRNSSEPKQPPAAIVEATVKESKGIIQGFCPV